MPLLLAIISILLFYRFIHGDIRQKFQRLLLVLIIILLVLSIMIYPKEAVESAKSGVNTWFQIVLPALLPFFIGAELLIRLGVVNFIGALLEPFIRPIFNVPGEGSFIFAMSLTSGYPVGVKLATKLRKEGVFSKFEAQRIISFCSTSGPLFMLGAVAIGMFQNLQLGIVIIMAHYLGAIMTGILFRFYGHSSNEKSNRLSKRPPLLKAFNDLLTSQSSSQKPFGLILGESVKTSVETILSVGGFIILFSVIIKLLTILNVIGLLSNLFDDLWFYLGINQAAQHSIISGIFEMTIGCKLLSDIQDISFLQQAIITTMLISWSGFSIHAQAASMIGGTDLNMGIYMFSKLLHSALSVVFVFPMIFISNIFFQNVDTSVFFNTAIQRTSHPWIDKIIFSSELFIAISITICIFSLIFHVFFKIYHVLFSVKK